jgi:hypothetical protein
MDDGGATFNSARKPMQGRVLWMAPNLVHKDTHNENVTKSKSGITDLDVNGNSN